MSQATITDWIIDAMADPEKEACHAIALSHKEGTSLSEIYTVKFNAKKWEPKELANLLYNKAKLYSQALTGVQTFNLQAFYGGKNQPEATQSFCITGALSFDGATEAPTTSGQIQQGMRLTEMLVQQSFRQAENTNRILLELTQTLHNRNQQMQHEVHDAQEIVRDVIFRQVAENHANQMQELEYKRKSEERQKYLNMAPGLVNTLFGKEIFPQNQEDTALVETVFDNLSDEHIQMFSSMFKPEMVGPFMARYHKHLQKKNAEKEAMAKGLALAPKPELEDEFKDGK